MEKKEYNLIIQILLILFLYTYQGILYGYVSALKIYFSNQKVDYNHLSVYEMISIPIYTKFIFSPFLDLHYVKRIGKRMSYIMSISFFLFFYYIYLSLNIDLLLENLQIYRVTILLFIAMLLISIQDIAIDALCEESFKQNHQQYGPMMQTMGQIIGPLFSYNLYVYFMDKVEFIGYKFFIFNAFFILITSILSYLKINENYQKSEFSSALDIVKIFPCFFKNENLRHFIFYGFCTRFFLAYWGNVSQLVMLELGINKDQISKLSMISLLFSIISMVVISKVDFKDNASVFKKSYRIYYFYLFAVFCNFMNLYYTQNQNLFFMISILLLVFGAVGNLIFTSYSVFINRIVDKNAGATFLSVMNSLSNIPTLMFNPLFTWSLNYGFILPGSIMLTCQGIFIFGILDRSLNRIKNTKKEEFSLSYKKKLN